MTDEEIRKGLQSRKVADRLGALRAIRHQELAELAKWSSAVLDALRDSSNLVVQAAVKCLKETDWLGGPPPIDSLAQAYRRLAKDGAKRDPGCVARIEMVAGLAAADAMECEDIFLDACETVQVERSGNGLEDMGVTLRAQAAAAIARVRPPGSLVALTLLLFDQEPHVDSPPQERIFATASVRKVAAQAIAALGDPGGVAVLVLRLAHSDAELPDVLVECMDALVHLDNDVALQRLPTFLAARNEYLVVGAATALARLQIEHHPTVVDLLIDACAAAPLESRESVGLALAAMRSQHGDDGLAVMLHHPDETVRQAAVVGLTQRGGANAKSLLTRVAELDPIKSVRDAAHRALQA